VQRLRERECVQAMARGLFLAREVVGGRMKVFFFSIHAKVYEP